MSYFSNRGFARDALLHKLQDEADNMNEIIRDALYQFISFYKEDELDRLDLRILADRFVDEEYDKEKKWMKQCLTFYG